ncbi:MAG: homocysteine S-methyltransferase family protein [Bacteroidales bacterium]
MAINIHHIFNNLHQRLDNTILVLDGAMGTMIQNHNLTEKQYRGNQFQKNTIDQAGNNEILNLTHSQI